MLRSFSIPPHRSESFAIPDSDTASSSFQRPRAGTSGSCVEDHERWTDGTVNCEVKGAEARLLSGGGQAGSCCWNGHRALTVPWFEVRMPV